MAQNYLNTYIDTLDTYVDPVDYDCVMEALTHFFHGEGYTEVCTQNRFSILAACEDPKNVVAFEYCNKIWPLPQTGQMWLEYEILTRPELQGVFCKTTSYREEKNIVPDRHFVCFPLFEFETRGTFKDLLDLLTRLLEFLGYQNPVHLDYDEVAAKYQTKELEHCHEQQMYVDYGNACFLKHFPSYTNPFWNMKYNEGHTHAFKVDVIMSGAETIGCAERSCDNERMAKMFHTICNGEYKQMIFDKFTEERTLKELDAFLDLEKCPRVGAGLGVTRLIKSLKMEGLMESLKIRFPKKVIKN